MESILAVALLALFPAASLGQLPNGACSASDNACEPQGDNVIGVVGGVTGLCMTILCYAFINI